MASLEQFEDWQRVHYGLMPASEYRAKWPLAENDFPCECERCGCEGKRAKEEA